MNIQFNHLLIGKTPLTLTGFQPKKRMLALALPTTIMLGSMLTMGNVWAVVINVPSNELTIQAGINAAVNGDTVLVQAGTYIENINFKGKKITVKSVDGADTTTIDGNHLNSVVIFENGEDKNSVLEGFKLINGLGTTKVPVGGVSGRTHGGGVWIYNNSSPSLKKLIITGNSAQHGAGIAVWSNSNAYVENTLMTHNESSWGTIGVWYGSNLSLTNVTIADNAGCGAWIHGSKVQFTNTILWNNLSSWKKEIIAYSSNNTIDLINSAIREGQQSVGYVDSSDTINWSGVTLNTNPLFANTAIKNYRLSSQSTLIDVGTNNNVPADDLTGGQRDANPDIGAYEFGVISNTPLKCPKIAYSIPNRNIVLKDISMELYNPITDEFSGKYALFKSTNSSLNALPGFKDFKFSGTNITYANKLLDTTDNCYPSYSSKQEILYIPRIEVPLVSVPAIGGLVPSINACYSATFNHANTQKNIFTLMKAEEVDCN